MDRLSEIRARCEAATPGPWFNFGDWLIHTETDIEHNGIPHEKTIGSVKAQNAAFIAHAREDVPYLLSRIEKAEAALSAMRFAYVNKDPDTPHAFEVDAMNADAGILGEWPPKGE